MKFEELKRSLKLNKYNNFILVGDDNFLLDRAYRIIEDAYNIEFKDLNCIKFNENYDCEQIVKALETLPCFSEYKIVYLDLSNKGNKLINTKLLEEYIENFNKQSILVISVGEYEQNLTLVNKENFTIVDCSRVDKELARRFIDSELSKKGKSFESDEAFDELYNFTNGDLASANNELIKLCNFVGSRKDISKEDIECISIKNIEFQIYELTENLAKKDAKAVFEILNELKNQKEGFKGTLALIYNHFRRLLHISLNQTLNKQNLATMLGIKEFAVGRLERQIKYFSKIRLKEICDECATLDYQIKNSMINVDLAVEMLVLKILE